jgi:hypothetical protein
MKRIILTLIILFISAALVYGMDYEVTKKLGDYYVQVKVDRNPPVVGENNMMIWMKDADGNNVKGATISVDYRRATILWMSTKKYNAYAQPHENNYHAILEFPTQGSWDVTINIRYKGKRVSTSFRIDVK